MPGFLTMTSWILCSHVSLVVFLPLVQSTSSETVGLSQQPARNREGRIHDQSHGMFDLSQLEHLASNNPTPSRLNPRARRSSSRIGEFRRQLADKGDLLSARGSAFTSQFRRGFPQQAQQSSNADQSSAGSDQIVRGIGAIHNAIDAFAGNSTTFPSQQFHHVGLEESIPDQTLDQTELTPRTSRNDNVQKQKSTPLDRRETNARSSLLSKVRSQNKAKVPQPLLERAGLFSNAEALLAPRNGQSDDFGTNRLLGKSLPQFNPRRTSSLDSRLFDYTHQAIGDSFQNVPNSNTRTPSLPTQIIIGDSFQNVPNTNPRSPSMTGSWDGGTDSPKPLESQQVSYKDAHVIHPHNSPSQYPSYPVFENTRDESDMTVLASLLRNLHVTERRAQALLDARVQ